MIERETRANFSGSSDGDHIWLDLSRLFISKTRGFLPSVRTLRVCELRIGESRFLGNSAWTWEFHPLAGDGASCFLFNRSIKISEKIRASKNLKTTLRILDFLRYLTWERQCGAWVLTRRAPSRRGISGNVEQCKCCANLVEVWELCAHVELFSQACKYGWSSEKLEWFSRESWPVERHRASQTFRRLLGASSLPVLRLPLPTLQSRDSQTSQRSPVSWSWNFHTEPESSYGDLTAISPTIISEKTNMCFV